MRSSVTKIKVFTEFSQMVDPTPAGNFSHIDPFSEREMEIIQFLGSGTSNKEIAARLYITEGTVKNHFTNIYRKLGVPDRTKAALKARELGLI